MTPRPGPRTRRAELLDVATQLFYEKGYAHTTLQDIADRMGFTKAAIYYYAKNKEELLVEIYTAIVEPAIARARELAAASGADGATVFVALIEQHLQTFLRNVEANAVFDVQNFSLSEPAKTAHPGARPGVPRVLRRVYDAGHCRRVDRTGQLDGRGQRRHRHVQLRTPLVPPATAAFSADRRDLRTRRPRRHRHPHDAPD